jgi:hypothetical protein
LEPGETKYVEYVTFNRTQLRVVDSFQGKLDLESCGYIGDHAKLLAE